MKKIYLSIAAALAISSAATAQCGGRYDANVYSGSNITATSGIVYGSNISYNGTTTSLTLDFYEPSSDTSHARPLIIWAHGGSFLGGASTDADVDTLCHRFAKKGYACASINYRLGVAAPDSADFIQAVVRGVQDMKAAIRFFYKDKQTSNTYKIDTNNIFIGGSSAGAFIALHTVYLKRSCQITTYMSQATLDGLGGIDGYSGNQCYSQHVKGVISLCGALGTYGWLEAGDLPFCSMHGNADNTVNYSRGPVLPTFPVYILTADGDRMLKAQALAVGVQNNFYTWYGADHVPYAGNTATEIKYMDTTVNFVKDYLLQRLNYSCTISQAANTPYGTANLYSFTNCSTNSPLACTAAGIKYINANLLQEVYPNPSNSDINVVFVNSNATHYVALTDISGRVVKSATTTGSTYTLDRNTLTSGVYFLHVSNAQGESSVQKIIFY